MIAIPWVPFAYGSLSKTLWSCWRVTEALTLLFRLGLSRLSWSGVISPLCWAAARKAVHLWYSLVVDSAFASSLVMNAGRSCILRPLSAILSAALLALLSTRCCQVSPLCAVWWLGTHLSFTFGRPGLSTCDQTRIQMSSIGLLMLHQYSLPRLKALTWFS